MKYLLSTGLLTTSKIEYVKDLILLECNLDENSIPESTIGSLKPLNAPTKELFKDEVEIWFRNIMTKVESTTGVDLTLESIEVNKDSISIKLLLNKNLITYELKEGL